MNVSKEFKFSSRNEHILRYVDFFSSLGLKEHLWLTPREKQFFVHCVLLFNEGVDLASKEAVNHLESNLNFKSQNRGVYIYRNRLKKKGWLRQTENSITIPSSFIFPEGEIPTMEFKIKFIAEHVD